MTIVTHRMLRAALAVGLAGAVTASELFDENAEWRYFKGLSEASSPDPTAWRQLDFDDSDWLVGQGPFFYENHSGYSGHTELTDMRGSYISVFLRHAFEVPNPADFETLTLNLRADDGCIVWLNGREVARVNMPGGEPTYETAALNAGQEPNVATVVITNTPGLLLPGRNVIAAQACNVSLGNSSDFLFAAALSAQVDEVPPVVIEVLPRAGAIVRQLDRIEVVFSENVTGVDAGDLLINGAPATGLETYSPRDYSFSFAAPPSGAVTVAWAADHGITDRSGAANPFTGTGWSYTLDPNAPAAQVIISEFLAANDTGIRDEDGDRSDWIELLNLSPEPVSLNGWFLTDDAERPTKWRLPKITLADGEYLLIRASGKDRAIPGRELHTNFKLNTAGEYLALLDPQTNVVSAFAPAYPPQRDDVSYGRDLLSPEVTGYFPTPTPGAANVPGGPGFAPDPVFNLAGGLYATNRLVIEISAPDGEIFYSTNGLPPLTHGVKYTGPIPITGSVVFKARVQQDGLLPSRPVAAGYHLVADNLKDFTSNLPLLVVKPVRSTIPRDTRVPVYLTSIEPFRGRTALLGPAAWSGMGEMEIRGQSSTGFPKKQYNLETDDAAGQDLEVPLLGLPAESDWVLNGPYSDKSLLNNYLAFELHEKMGHYAVRRRFVEVFIDENRGQLKYPTDYRGIYVLLEKIKIDKHRVNIARMTPATSKEPEISGGYIFKKDKNSAGDKNFSTRGGAGFGAQNLKYHDPKPKEITLDQQHWLRDYVIDFEKALYADDWLRRTGARHYSHFIDVPSFVDNHWIVEFTKQIDGYRLSDYFYKDRNGPIHMAPIWDWNLSFGNADYLQGWDPTGWYYPLIDPNAHIWLRRLICGTPRGAAGNGDPDFYQALIDRWSVLRTNVLSASNVVARIDEIAAYLDEAKDREFDRWPRLNRYVWPNPRQLYVVRTYAQIIANKKKWIQDRFAWIDRQFLHAPEFNRPAGTALRGSLVALSAKTGAIFYTLDGTDPRAPGGAPRPDARQYTQPVILNGNVRIFARARQGTRWSGPAVATFVTGRAPLLISEIMYHPRPPAEASIYGSEDFEYLELLNTGDAPLNLDDFRFADGIEFAFAGGAIHTLAPGERVLLVRNRTAFASRYGAGLPVAGEFTGNLDNAGETLRLVGPVGEPVQTFRFKDGWYPATDGVGFALVTAADVTRANGGTAADWRTGSVLDGTPGRPEPAAPALPRVVINEVRAHSVAPETDAIELFNPASDPVDVSGWYLSDDPGFPKYRLPEGSVLPGHGFLVVTAEQFQPGPDQPNGLRLGATGDDAWLFSADAEGRLTGYVHGFRFGATQPGDTIGRYVSEAGEEQFAIQSAPTLGEANAGPRVGPVIISEVHYHPRDVFVNGAWWDAPEYEYLELFNLEDAPVLLADPAAPTNTWRLRDAVRYTFPTNVTMAAGERLLVVGFDPEADTAQMEAFRARFNLPAETRLFGPWRGKLDNHANSVELVQRMRLLDEDDTPRVVSVLLDRVAYRDTAPWPVGADGLGFALQRVPEDGFGNDPAHWRAATPTPGSAPEGGAPPEILTGPADQWLALGGTTTLSVLAQGDGALTYRWRRNGRWLPEAGEAALTLTNAQPATAGVYEVVVANAHGAAASVPARIQVFRPDADEDLDGLSDLYEVTYGLNPRRPDDTRADDDGDGMSTAEEFIAGTDPTNADSRLGFDQVEAGDGIVLTFQAAGNRAYVIEYRNDLEGGAWMPLADVPPEQPPTPALRPVSVTDRTQPPPPRRYYRLRAHRP